MKISLWPAYCGVVGLIGGVCCVTFTPSLGRGRGRSRGRGPGAMQRLLLLVLVLHALQSGAVTKITVLYYRNAVSIIGSYN